MERKTPIAQAESTLVVDFDGVEVDISVDAALAAFNSAVA